MGANAQSFLQLRQQDIISLYDATFTKKEAVKAGENLANIIIESGEVSKHEALANLIRLNEVISNAITKIKISVMDEKVTILGVEFNPTNGRRMYNFSEDELYKELQFKLKQREELLKTASNQKEAFYDSDGVEIPKISVSSAKDSLTIKF